MMPDPLPAHNDLKSRLQAEDETALAELFSGQRDRLLRMIDFRMDERLRSRLWPDDVLQDAFLAARQRLGRIAADGFESPFVWLRMVVHQTLIDLHRRHLGAQMRDAGREVSLEGRRFSQTTSASMAIHLVGDWTTPTQAAVRSERFETVKRTLEQMEPLDREILALRHFEELTNGEAAEELGIQAKAASIRYVRALVRESLQLQKTQEEHRRAEANLDLAMQAFDEVFDRMTLGRSPAVSADPEVEPAYASTLSARDAAILQNLLTFYDRFAEQNRDRPDLRGQIAQAYLRVGQIQNGLGQFEKAQMACRTALALLEQGIQTPAGADKGLRMKADLYHELGFTAQMMGQHRNARDSYRSSLDILKGLSAASSGDQAVQFALAKGYEELGSIPSGQGGPDDPTDRQETGKDPDASTRRALEILTNLTTQSPENPEYQQALARTFRNLAASHLREGQEPEAEQALGRSIVLLTRLTERYPANATYLYDLIATYTLDPSPKGPGAGPRRQISPAWQGRSVQALDLAERLNRLRPDVPAYIGLLGRSHLKVANVCLGKGQRQQAEDHLGQAVADLDQLVGQGLYASAYLCDYLQATQTLSRLLSARDQWDQARSLLEKRLNPIEQAVSSGSRRRREWVLLAKQYEDLAVVCSHVGDASRAQDAAQRARQIRLDQDLDPDQRPRPPQGGRSP